MADANVIINLTLGKPIDEVILACNSFNFKCGKDSTFWRVLIDRSYGYVVTDATAHDYHTLWEYNNLTEEDFNKLWVASFTDYIDKSLRDDASSAPPNSPIRYYAFSDSALDARVNGIIIPASSYSQYLLRLNEYLLNNNISDQLYYYLLTIITDVDNWPSQERFHDRMAALIPRIESSSTSVIPELPPADLSPIGRYTTTPEYVTDVLINGYARNNYEDYLDLCIFDERPTIVDMHDFNQS